MPPEPGPSIDTNDAAGRAIAALKSGLPQQALPIIEQALKSATGDARLWHLYGLAWRDQDRRELAIPALERAAALAPSQPLIAHGLARTLFEAGLPSVDAFGRAVTLAPGDPEVLKGMVAALIAERRLPEAIEGLHRALGRSPSWVDGHSLLADLRWIDGERDGFTRSFDEALTLQPRNLDLRRQQLIILLHAERYDDALDRIAEGRAMMGDHAMFVANEAIVHSERGELSLADPLFETIANLPDSATQIRRVRHLLRRGHVEQACAVVEAWLPTSEAAGFWPYASAGWRMMGDPRWQWLEGNVDLVGTYDITARLPPLDILASTLRKLHTTRGQPLVQSVRGGTQTDGNLFHHVDPVIVQMREAVRSAVAEHARRLPDDNSHPTLAPSRGPIRFSGAWSVRLKARGYHCNHVHPMGWLSSALYISLPADVGDGEAGWLTVGDPGAPSMPLDLGPLRTIEPKPGRLVLFPSWMWHGTRPFGEGERLTVAFDVATPPRG